MNEDQVKNKVYKRMMELQRNISSLKEVIEMCEKAGNERDAGRNETKKKELENLLSINEAIYYGTGVMQ